MKIVTFIVKDTDTGQIAKFNARLKYDGSNEVEGSLNGVVVKAKLPHWAESILECIENAKDNDNVES